MQRILTLLLALVGILPLAAQSNGVKGYIVPEGQPVIYSMSAYLLTSVGQVHYDGLYNEISTSIDGKSVYFRTLFPAQFEQLWVKGTLEGDEVTIDCKTPIASATVYDEYGKQQTIQLKVGEPIFDENDEVVDVRDVVFYKVGTTYLIEDDDFDHPVALYYIDEYGIELQDYTFCATMDLYTGPTDLVTPPADAAANAYTYDYNDDSYRQNSEIGHVAVKGNDYYFDRLIPGVEGWVKGVREGNKITVSKRQLYSNDPLILCFGGLLLSSGGRMSDVVFIIENDGTLVEESQEQFCIAYLPNGSVYTGACRFTIRPYDESAPLTPSDPTNVVSRYYTELRQHAIEFNQSPTATDGSKLNPDQLGYYIYVNGERFTFNRKQYPYLAWESTQFIPYAYCDDYNNGDIFYDGYNSVLFYFDNYETLGVQSVYRAGDKEARGNIITVDKYNNVEIVPEGISNIVADNKSNNSSWYDLCGRRLTKSSENGISIKNGRKSLKIKE